MDGELAPPGHFSATANPVDSLKESRCTVSAVRLYEPREIFSALVATLDGLAACAFIPHGIVRGAARSSPTLRAELSAR
jgi:hypothetical protein